MDKLKQWWRSDIDKMRWWHWVLIFVLGGIGGWIASFPFPWFVVWTLCFWAVGYVIALIIKKARSSRSV